VTRLVHFFFVSKLQPAHAVVVCGACVALGVWTLSYDPGELDSALGLLLVVQMFLASTGFTSRAFAGHFDPVLLAGGSRPRAALAHWAVSIAPGVAGWIVLAVVALALGSPAARSALIGLSWVAGYRLPRGAAGVLWLVVLVAVLLQHNLRALSMTMEQGVRAWPWDTAVLLVCPFVLIGNKPEVPAAVLAAAALLACLAAASAVKATRHLNVLLMERG
jgi:hypothetical protein